MKKQQQYYHFRGHDVYGYGLVQDDMDFLRLLIDLDQVLGKEHTLLAYCLLTDHCHVLISSSDQSDPPDIACSGFIGWVRSPEIRNLTYLQLLIAYIHRLPVQYGEAENLQGYSFTSFNDILYEQDRLVDCCATLQIFGDHDHFLNVHRRITQDLYFEFPDCRI